MNFTSPLCRWPSMIGRKTTRNLFICHPDASLRGNKVCSNEGVRVTDFDTAIAEFEVIHGGQRESGVGDLWAHNVSK